MLCIIKHHCFNDQSLSDRDQDFPLEARIIIVMNIQDSFGLWNSDFACKPCCQNTSIGIFKKHIEGIRNHLCPEHPMTLLDISINAFQQKMIFPDLPSGHIASSAQNGRLKRWTLFMVFNPVRLQGIRIKFQLPTLKKIGDRAVVRP